MSITSGPRNSDLLIVGEYPGVQELRKHEPLVGSSGQEFIKMLAEAGIDINTSRFVYVTDTRPYIVKDYNPYFPGKQKLTGSEAFRAGRYYTHEIATGLQNLAATLAECKPRVIIAVGDTALWALTGESGINKWRGSLLWSNEYEAWIIPVISPATILRMWAWRHITVQDLRRARRQLIDPITEPVWNFIVAPSYEKTVEVLNMLKARLRVSPFRISCDIETRHQHTDCIGLSWNATSAICIPFFSMNEMVDIAKFIFNWPDLT